MAVQTHGSFIVLHHWKIRSLMPWLNIPLTLSCYYLHQTCYPNIELTSICPILDIQSARPSSDKYQLHKALFWLGWDSTFCMGILQSINLTTIQSFKVQCHNTSFHSRLNITLPRLPNEITISMPTGCGGRIGRALVSRTEDRGFKPRSSQTNDL